MPNVAATLLLDWVPSGITTFGGPLGLTECYFGIIEIIVLTYKKKCVYITSFFIELASFFPSLIWNFDGFLLNLLNFRVSRPETQHPL